MPGLVPLLSALIFATGAKGSGTSGFPADRAGRGSNFGTPTSPVAVPGLAPLSPTVMPGLVPGIHVLRHRGASRERARRRTHVDARNKSGHDDRGGVAEATAPLDIAPAHRRTARAANLNRTAVDSFRASTSFGIAVRAWRGRGGRGTWMLGTSPGMTEERKKRRGSRARPCGGDNLACDCHRYRPGAPRDGGVPRRAPPRHAAPRIQYADAPAPRAHGRHLPTEMPTGTSSRQMSTFPPGICGARMSTR